MDVWSGCATFIYAWLQKCSPEVPPAIVRRLRKEGLFPEDVLTVIGGGLRAGVRRETPARWRAERDSISGIELAAWVHAAWLVANLIDFANGKGTVAKAMYDVAAKLAEQAREGPRRCGFCGAKQDQVGVLIATPDAYVCDRCVPIQHPRPLPDQLRGDERRCSFCGHPDRPMALGASARICEVCLRLSRDALRDHRRGTGVQSG